MCLIRRTCDNSGLSCPDSQDSIKVAIFYMGTPRLSNNIVSQSLTGGKFGTVFTC